MARPGGRAGRDDAARATTRRRSTAPPTPACSATRRRSRSRSAGSWPRTPRGRAGAVRRVAAADAGAVRPGAAGSSRQHDGTLLFSGDSGVPLVRYHIADEGGLIGYEDMLALLRRGTASTRWPTARAPGRARVRPLPFVYVFGRSHFTVSYFGANVYPENVTVGLEQPAVSALGHRQVRARGGRGRRPATRTWPSRSSSRPARTPDAGARARARASRSARSCAAEQRVRPLRAGRYQLPAGHAAAGRRPRVLPGRRQAPLHPGNERPVMRQESPAHHAGGYQILEKVC